ncbi:MAG: acetolactate decarboxylase [Methanomicrobiales archaeon]|nr:acetolactate decarboxylase [Methanomicrobiales archaeon]
MELPRVPVLVLVIAAVLIFLAGFISAWTTIPPSRTADQDLLFQVSTYTSLSGGGYDPIEQVRALMKNGDLGLGTFTGLDGEMVVVDGTCYQVTSDGIARQADPSLGVPFAGVTFFSPDLLVPGITAGNMTELTGFIDTRLPSKDQFYAIRITGHFPYIRARSPPAQDKPYPPLADALKEQSVYEFRNVTGTAAGFYTPASAAGIGFPGYHLHFLTGDRSRGGHILDMTTAGNTVELDGTPRLTVILADDRAPVRAAGRGEDRP